MRPLGERDPAASQVRRAADAVARGWGRRHLELTTIQEGAESQLGAADLDTYTRRYMRPLVELLVGYVETGDPAYADVYRDERQRFGLNGELPELLAVDEAELLAAVGSESR